MHSAQDPRIDKIPREMHFLIKKIKIKSKKEEEGKRKRNTRNAIQTRVDYRPVWILLIFLKTKN